jgi:hypothetical protein
LRRKNPIGYFEEATSHIPDKGQVMVRYYGLYANGLPRLQASCQLAAEEGGEYE